MPFLTRFATVLQTFIAHVRLLHSNTRQLPRLPGFRQLFVSEDGSYSWQFLAARTLNWESHYMRNERLTLHHLIAKTEQVEAAEKLVSTKPSILVAMAIFALLSPAQRANAVVASQSNANTSVSPKQPKKSEPDMPLVGPFGGGQSLCASLPEPVRNGFADPPKIPSYIADGSPVQSGKFFADVDSSLLGFSPALARWVVSEIDHANKTFGRTLAWRHKDEHREIYRLAAAIDHIASIRHTTSIQQKDEPENVRLEYSYIYNRHTNTVAGAVHIFAELVELPSLQEGLFVEVQDRLNQLFIEAILDDENLAAYYGSSRDDREREIEGRLKLGADVFAFSLYKDEEARKFSGIRYFHPEYPPNNHLGDRPFFVDIEASKFRHLLKPGCQSLFE